MADRVQVSLSVAREVWDKLVAMEQAGVKSVGAAVHEALEAATADFTPSAPPEQPVPTEPAPVDAPAGEEPTPDGPAS